MRAKNIIQKFKHILNKYVEQLDIKNSRNIGRPNKFNNFFYIKHILNYLFTGISWSNIELFIDDNEYIKLAFPIAKIAII